MMVVPLFVFPGLFCVLMWFNLRPGVLCTFAEALAQPMFCSEVVVNPRVFISMSLCGFPPRYFY